MTVRRNQLSFIPPLLPNQTLYSWGAMFHEMSGNATVDESLVQTFALTRKGLHFHIPSHLEALCTNTQLALGSAEDIVKIATTLPYYTKFRSPDVARRIMKLVRGNSSHGVAQALGMAKTTSNAHPPRRSCYQCIQADIDTFGFAYWHRNHQLPGVLICPKHSTTLLSLSYDHDSILREKFLRPDDDWNLIDVIMLPDWPTDALNALNCLAQLATDMAKSELMGGYSISKMRNACLSMLTERNLIAADGSFLVTQALYEYENHYNSVADVPEIAMASQSSIRPLLYVLRLADCRTHPLEWMLVIDWLFGDWDTFEEKYRMADEAISLIL